MDAVLARGTLATILLGLWLGQAAGAPAEAQWAIWTASSLASVRRHDPPGAARKVRLAAARREAEGAVVVVRAPAHQPLRDVAVTVSALVGPGKLPAGAVTLYRAQYVPVRRPSRWHDAGSPHAPAEWPDALVPFDLPGGRYASAPFTVPPGENQPILVEVVVPAEAAAGEYRGTITVRAPDQAPASIPLSLEVWDFALPRQPTLASEFGLYDTAFERARRAAGAGPSLAAHLAAALEAHRLGMGEARPPSTEAERSALASWLATRRHLLVPRSLSDEEVGALRQHGEASGWNGALAHYAIDEPETPAQFQRLRERAARYRRLGIPVMTTIKIRTAWAALDGHVDVWVPVFYECVPELIRSRLARGERVWSYTAGVQPTGYPTWLLDYDLINFRIPPWLNFVHRQTGLLYWATAHWEVGDPWTNAADENGEGVLFYPGGAVGAPDVPIPSARLKAIRDGMEDYEYLARLASLGQSDEAHRRARQLAPAWNAWSTSPARLARTRDQIARRILALQKASR